MGGRSGAAAASVVEAGEIHLHDPALIADAPHLQDHVDRGLKVSDDLAETELGALRHHQKREPVHRLASGMGVQRCEGARMPGVALPLNLRHDAFGDIFCP